MAVTDLASSPAKGGPAGAGPTITLPRGGGAIRGVGEKFTANAATGAGSLAVPLAASPGRGGFGPQLSLAYDSGSGNGPFGFGWSLSAPHITRKTDKGRPLYQDGTESDVFLLSGVDDLIPVGAGLADVTTAPGYRIHRYRPRIEGLFARIERWTRSTDGDVHWRSLSKDNILTLYGSSLASRIADPLAPSRVFSWLISETRDDLGNATLYDYRADDGVGVDLAAVHERNRGETGDLRRTANRYLKRIRYGNRTPLLEATGHRPRFLTAAQIQAAGWMFELVFDYGEHDLAAPTPHDAGPWDYRADSFSSYRPGFEVRTTRLCRRVLMFHHFAAEAGVGDDCLVRSTDLTYSHQQDPASARNPVYTFLRAATQTGYRRDAAGGYVKRSLPPVEFEYSLPQVQDRVQEVDGDSLETLPIGVDGRRYLWTDLHGEGIPGVLTEQAGAWFYKRNLSPIRDGSVEFTPGERTLLKPNLSIGPGQAQFMDLAGDGQPDLVVMNGPTPGFYEHDDGEGWLPFRPFSSRLNRDMRAPNLTLVDLDGDGLADVLITEQDTLVWHASLGEAGFGPANRVAQALDEEKGPRIVLDDGAQSIHLADMSGDGWTDLVRVRWNEVCYWPNLGGGRFGAKVTMDRAPRLDNPDQFEQRRVRLADIDGSGTTDLIYLHRDGVRLWFNQSGNGWSDVQVLRGFPQTDQLASTATVDLLGDGTACLVWSSSAPASGPRPMRYLNLMGGQKPHLLVKVTNNLGAETRLRYAPSTKFYLQDRRDGRPWLTRLPFPVHVVERVETYDHISCNRFVTRYAYHHGHFDGVEREFRGFAMVEQWDSEEVGALTGANASPAAANTQSDAQLPPTLTKTWYHTGLYLGRDHVSDAFAGLLDASDAGEYYREPGLTDAQARAMLLPDTTMPAGLSLDEEREACRALKGMMLRQEVYGLDGSAAAAHPYSVVEQTFSLVLEQARGVHRHGVFSAYPREAITYHYERDPADPRIQHALTLQVDAYGNVLKAASIGYGRRQPDMTLPLQVDRDRQTRSLITYTESRLTNAIDDFAAYPDDHRSPLAAESRTWELTGVSPENGAARFSFGEWARGGFALATTASDIPYEQAADHLTAQRRLIKLDRTLYRPDDLGVSRNDPLGLLALGKLEPRALAGEGYSLAFTPGLVSQVFQRGGAALMADPAAVLGGAGSDRGGYLRSQALKADGRFPAADPDDHWWAPSGRAFLSPNTADTAAQELAQAQAHFFLPRRIRSPFHTAATNSETLVEHDAYDLLPVEVRDAVGAHITAGERLVGGARDPAKPGNDYRVLQPRTVTDANRNRTAAAFDALGLVVGTAVMGKPEEQLGDSLAGFAPDLDEAVILDHMANPLAAPLAILGRATTRVVYDLFAYQRTKDLPAPQPAAVYAMARETHDADLEPGATLRIQHSFAYSDGFDREIQRKLQAEPGEVGSGGATVDPRWVASGWSIFNNKGKPVRVYEPFFSATQSFEFGVQVGVSPILFYDPLARAVATLHPDHSYEKVTFDPWRQTTWDANDTVLLDPRTDADVAGYTNGYFKALAAAPGAQPWLTWHAQRQGGGLGGEAQAAAVKAQAHAGTPATACFDTLGRPFLTLADNGPDPAHPGSHLLFASRIELDIEGHQLAVRDGVEQAGDSQGRIVMRYAYDMASNRIRQASMDAGARWMLGDVAGQQIRAWDSRGHASRTEYDPLRRPLRVFVTGAEPATPNLELLTERLVYGEQHPQDEALNLRGKLYLHYDQAGAAATEACDFKGNTLRASRRVALDYKLAIDWTAVDAAFPGGASAKLDPATVETANAPLMEPDVYANRILYDALNRPTALTSPHTPAMQPNLMRPGYGAGGLLERMEVNLGGATSNGQPVWTTFVSNIHYDPKGQRRRIDYGNGVSTLYAYDPLTFRLVSLVTRRHALAFPGDAPQPAPADWPGRQVQNLSYTYDPVGNISRVRDDAQQAIYFRNKRVEPGADYLYDALYRLVRASGREHLGQAGAPVPNAFDDAPRVGIDWAANDGSAMGTYVEAYAYDAVGNLLATSHRGADPVNPGWMRSYAYAETSLIEDGTGGTAQKIGNRLSSTTIGAAAPVTERYVYNAHGDVARLPHLAGVNPAANLAWDWKDQLRRAQLGGGGAAYYVYDGAGQRVRKIWEKSANLVEERLYLGGFEIFRRRRGADRLERETLHVMDDKQRIALVETRTLDTAGSDPSPARLTRYQVANPLGSACLELNAQAQIISYEEYSPYGSTTYQAVRSQTEAAKRYRYIGKERDEETGLSYHGARYYASWLGRWMSCDPAGTIDGLTLYTYASSDPIGRSDSTGLADDDDWSMLDDLWDKEKVQVVDPRAPLSPASSPMSKEGARAYGNQQARDFRVSQGMNEGATVQAGHTAAARHAPESGISQADWDTAPMQELHSRKGQGLDVSVTDQAGETKIRTRHTSQEGLIDDAVARVKEANGGKLTPQGQLDAAEEVRWRTENVPMDQRDVRNVLAEGKDAKSAAGGGTKAAGAATSEGSKVAEATKLATSEGKEALSVAAKTGAKEALQTAEKTGLKQGAKMLGTKAAKFIPFVGIGVGVGLVANDLKNHEYGTALLDAAEAIPVVGDVVGAAHAGVAAGGAANELLGIEGVASEHGAAVEGAARSLGLSADNAQLVGATGAALSSITVAPTIALQRKIVGWFK